MRDFDIVTAPHRDSLHWEASRVSWEDVLAWVRKPGKIKAAGNYLFGTLRPTTVEHQDQPCTALHRRKDAVLSRSMLTLDVDHPEPDFADRVELLFPYAALMHNTYSSTPDEPRYRLLVPTDRDLAPDEYQVATAALISQLGEGQFDPGTTQPERYMFKPATQNPDWFHYQVIDSDVLVVDELLVDFEEDLSVQPLPAPNRTKRDPFEIAGVIGSFNKAYAEWDLLIEVYDLPYTKVSDDRYQLVGARSQAGMGPIQGTEGFVYSHHSNDPAFGKTCSAFDLVRLHRFGDLDEGTSSDTPVNKLPSHLKMVELATADHRAIAEMVGADFDADSNDWRLRFQRGPRTQKILDVMSNWDLIVDNDPVFNVLCYNEMTKSVEAHADLPWRAVGPERVIATTDRSEYAFHIEREYNFRPNRLMLDGLIDSHAKKRLVHPLREYLENLVWDGIPRVETCLPGVADSAYNRLVARKSLTAAVARVFKPGCKWDHTLVLYGEEGIGKSWWIDKIARGYSAPLGNPTQKDTLLTLLRSWIMISDEGHSLRKDESDVQKDFLTRTSDVFRLPYDRETLVHPRHSVIWSTTNDETILRRQEGNRRFLIVHCQDRVDFDSMTDEYIDQLWAEAVYLYRAGEQLFLGDLESSSASAERERFVEEDALGGLIQEYLDTLVPEDWWARSPESRKRWLFDRAAGFEPPGTEQIQKTCSTQIWVEALAMKIGEHRRSNLLDITNALNRLEGWESLTKQHRLPGYGPQLIFVRTQTRHRLVLGPVGRGR